MRVSTTQFAQTGTNAILDQQSRLLKTQQQLASGRKILNPADDPAGAARVLDLEKSVGQVEQYKRNLDRAELALRAEESALESAGNVIQRIRELTVQAANASQDGGNRKLIAAEIRQSLQQLVELGNATDGTGEFLFSGSNTKTKPFALEGGDVTYAGDQTQRMIQAGPSRQIATNHSGFEPFIKIATRNGDFTTAPAAGNTGTGVIEGGRVLDNSVAFDGPYTLVFDGEGDDRTATVTNGAGDTVSGPESFRPGESVSFDGRSVTVNGQPDDGDSFTIEASGFQSVFRSVSDLAEAMEGSGADESASAKARFQNAANTALGNLDQALDSFLTTRAEVGARLNAVDGEREANESSLLDLEEARSRIEDLDYAEAISRLNLQRVGLEAAQQSYVRIQGLSLFNFL